MHIDIMSELKTHAVIRHGMLDSHWTWSDLSVSGDFVPSGQFLVQVGYTEDALRTN